jgi:pimeloyl-ACP methyl ester carboxylesterase
VNFLPCRYDPLAELGRVAPADRTLRVDCAEISVEASGPPRRRTAIGLVRVRLAASPPVQPPLLVLGESDGVSGGLLAAQLATEVPLPVLQRVELIGMDPRGSGVNKLGCAPGSARATLVGADPVAADQGKLDAQLEAARQIAQECSLDLNDALSSYATATTVGDMERARQVLGVPRLAAYGLGDGARTLSVWADRFPGSVGRVVLDAPPDPTLDPTAAAKARAVAAEGAFDAFAKDCTSRPGCPLGADPRATVRSLVDRLRGQPIFTTGGDRLTAGALVYAILRDLDEPSRWPALAGALAATGRGDPAAFAPAVDSMLGTSSQLDIALATNCNDVKQRASVGQILDQAGKWGSEQPMFGPLLAQRMVRCTPWPVPGDVAMPGAAPTAPPMLVLGSAIDARGVLDGTKRAAAALHTTQFVSWQGTGHGSYPRTGCVSDVVQGFLLDGVVPQSSVLCPP